MRNVQVTLYEFDELSDEAKKKALEQFRDINVHYDWWDYTIDNFVTDAEEAGYEIRTVDSGRRKRDGAIVREPDVQFTGFWSQGDGASFAAYVDIDKVAKRIGAEEELALARDEMEGGDPEIEVSITRGTSRYAHHYTMQREVYPWWLDGSSGVEASKAQTAAKELADAILDDARNMAQGLYRSLEEEHTYLTSEEAVVEAIRANEYDFTEDGEQF